MLLADGKLYVGDEDGIVTVFRAGRKKQILGSMDMGSPVWSAPSAAGGVLFIATSRRLFAIRRELE
jgi:hypothetical protein